MVSINFPTKLFKFATKLSQLVANLRPDNIFNFEPCQVMGVFWMIEWQLRFIIGLVVAQNCFFLSMLISVIDLLQREFPMYLAAI